MLSIKIFGTQQIQKHLHSKFNPVELEHALDLAGNLVLQDSKRVCPVEIGGGRLRASIDMQRCSRFCRSIGTSVEYAPYVELGTHRMIQAHGVHDPKHPVTSWEALEKRGGSGQSMPFLRFGLQKNKRVITQIIKEGMK